MLKQRVLTAIPLAALVVWGILTQPVEVIFYALLFAITIAGWEWAALSGIHNKILRGIYALIILASSYFAQQFLSQQEQYLTLMLGVTVLLWLVAIYHMFANGPGPVNKSFSLYKFFIGFVCLVPPVVALIEIREQGSLWLFYCLSIIWIADIGAYFSGKRYGKKKLAPHLSPGKTKEGLYGAVFATSAYSFLMGYVFDLQIIQIFMLLIIAVLATFISVAGDLFVSLLKREQDLKDTGRILPGHGGILDRIDSVTSSAPFLAFMLSLVIFNG